MSRIKRTARISFDIFLFIVVCLVVFGLMKWLQPIKRGFFCGDESLQYPYRESSIASVTIISISFVLPSLVILVVELFKRIGGDTQTVGVNSTGGTSCRLGYRLQQCYAQIGIYLVGLAMVSICSLISKTCIGRLRPHFFTVCQPQMPDGSTCSDPINQGRYIEEYTCTSSNYNAKVLQDLGQAFPSGHTTLMFYMMTYIAVYLQATLSTRASKLFKHLLQFACMMFAWYIALTRVSDYWHHWTDVLAGIVLGSSMALLVAIYVANVFSQNSVKSQAKSSCTSPAATSAKSATTPTTVSLPAYTFGNIPYLHHTQQYTGQTYHNYGYVP